MELIIIIGTKCKRKKYLKIVLEVALNMSTAIFKNIQILNKLWKQTPKIINVHQKSSIKFRKKKM